MSGKVSRGGVLEVDEFQYDLMKKLANNEDRLRENFEQMVLNNEDIEEELLELEGINPSKHDSTEVRKHLHEEVQNVINDIYKLVETGEGVAAVENYLERVEDTKEHSPVENCEQLGKILTNVEGAVPENFKNLLNALGNLALAGMTGAIAIMWMKFANSHGGGYMETVGPAWMVGTISIFLAANAKTHLGKIPSIKRFFDGVASIKDAVDSVLG